MRDELPDWMDAPGDDVAPPRRRLHRLLALAAVPWALVAVLVGWHGSGPPKDAAPPTTPPSASESTDEAPPAPAPSEPEAAAVADGDAAAGGTATTPDGPVTEEWRGGWREYPGDGATVAVAVVVARAWLTGLAPTLELGGITAAEPASYAEHLTVEAIERPGPGAAVVTLSAVVLDAAEPPTARVQRLAVPIDESAEDPRPAGAPWQLPAPALEPAAPVVADELGAEFWPAAEAALQTAGFDGELRGLQRSAGWPVLATVRTEGTDGPLDQIVWLRRHLDQFVVAGLPLSQALPPAEEAP